MSNKKNLYLPIYCAIIDAFLHYREENLYTHNTPTVAINVLLLNSVIKDVLLNSVIEVLIVYDNDNKRIKINEFY